MPSRYNISYRILKTYGFLAIDPTDQYFKYLGRRLPNKVEGETVKQWKERVLGDPNADIHFFYPDVPSQNTKVSTLERDTDAAYVLSMMNSLIRQQGIKAQELFDELDEGYLQRLEQQKKRYLAKLKAAEGEVKVVEKEKLVYEAPREVVDAALDNLDEAGIAVPASLERVLDKIGDDSVDVVALLTEVFKNSAQTTALYRALGLKHGEIIPE